MPCRVDAGRARARRTATSLLVAVVVALTGSPAAAYAGPADRSHPTADLPTRIGRLSAALTRADDDLRQASVTASVAVERYHRARDREHRAVTALEHARHTRTVADRRLSRHRALVAGLARANYELGGTVGATAAVLSGSPTRFLDNVDHLRFVANRQARALSGYRHAKGKAVLAAGAARSTLAARRRARARAEAARNTAQHAVHTRRLRVADLRHRRDTLQRRLDRLERHDDTLRDAAHARDRRLAREHAGDVRRAADTTRRIRRHPGSGDVATVVHAAVAQVGAPYVWDAADPAVGFDCSGLVLYAYARIGIDLPHSAEYQYRRGRPVPADRLRPGDLLFYSHNGHISGIHHVTMYVGNGMIVQAPDFGIPVQVVPAYFDYGYYGAVRLLR